MWDDWSRRGIGRIWMNRDELYRHIYSNVYHCMLMFKAFYCYSMHAKATALIHSSNNCKAALQKERQHRRALYDEVRRLTPKTWRPRAGNCCDDFRCDESTNCNEQWERFWNIRGNILKTMLIYANILWPWSLSLYVCVLSLYGCVGCSFYSEDSASLHCYINVWRSLSWAPPFHRTSQPFSLFFYVSIFSQKSEELEENRLNRFWQAPLFFQSCWQSAATCLRQCNADM